MNKVSNRQKVYNAIKLMLIVLIAITLVFSLFRPDKTYAAGENTITVKKVSTVTVYVSGPGVVLESSNNNTDVYKVDQGTSVTLYAVNESRLFSKWNITDANSNVVNSSSDSMITLTVDKSLEVSVTRKDATTSDYGKYILDRYIIEDETDLIAVQNIVAGTGTDNDFAQFYEENEVYKTKDQKDALAAAFRVGYFVVANNFTVYNEKFEGIGTNTYPFQGVICGMNNNVESTIFLTISQTEAANTNYYGLFKYLGNKAIVRNLNVVSTIGIKKADTNTAGTIYAGGLAGYMDNSLLVNVTVEAQMGIDVTDSTVYAGGIAGYTTSGTGFDSVGNVEYNGENTSWTIQSATGSKIYAGMAVGYAENTYVKELTINVTNSVIDLKSDKIGNNYNANTQVALGNLYGYYNNTTSTSIDDVQIIGTSGQTLRTVVNGGDSYVGGLIGYVNATTTNQQLNIVNVDFNVLGSKNQFISTSLNSSSKANLYTGGLIGYVNGNNCVATGAIRNGISTVQVDGESKKVLNYIFEGEYEIKSLQNGTGDLNDSTYCGKAIAGGLVGKGYININGTNNLRSSIVLASPTSKLTIDATQSKLTKTTIKTDDRGQKIYINDKEHACAALIYGSVGSTQLDIDYIDVYSNNTTVQTYREIGSKAMGDLHTGGFVGYVNKSTLDNVSILLNDSNINAYSLSYESDAKNPNTDTNSAFCGGVVGQATGDSKLSNLVVAGFDTITGGVIGTTLKMESIQNTPPGGDNYRGENYIGGIVGRIQRVAVDSCKYIGSEGSEDYIKMNGHESPDSAFCGGIVGMIRTDGNNTASSVSNCEIKNAYVYGSATNVSNSYSDPDIYVGGIVGAAYLHNNASALTISGCSVINTDVYGLANDYMAVLVAGIIGGATWENVACNVNDCYVVGGSVIARMSGSNSSNYRDNENIEAAAGGIMGLKGDNTTTFRNCAVIDVNIEATVDYRNSNNNNFENRLYARAAGLGAYNRSINYTLINCYTNATVNAKATVNTNKVQTDRSLVYPLAIAVTINNNNSNNSNNTYYLDKNVGGTSNDGTPVPSTGFADVTRNATNIYTVNYLNNRDGYGYKLRFVTESSYFTTSHSSNGVSTIRCNDMSKYHAAIVDVWINRKNGGDTSYGGHGVGSSLSPLQAYGSMEAANAAGWFLYDSVIINNGVNTNVGNTDIESIDSDYLNLSNVVYENTTTGDSSIVQNVNNAKDFITNRYFESINNNNNKYRLRVYDDMLTLKLNITFTAVADYNIVISSNVNLSSPIDISAASVTYGKITFTGNGQNYVLTLDPNELIESDYTFYIGFKIGDTGVYTSKKIEIELVHNEISIVGVTFADYTPPHNYYDKSITLGTKNNPYQLSQNSITKFIPVVTKSNDIVEGKTYALEQYIERYNYSISSDNQSIGTIYSSGELKAEALDDNQTTRTGSLTLTDRINGKTAKVYISIVKYNSITYDVTGSDVSGLTYVTSQTDFYFEQVIRSNYSGTPTTFTIKIGNGAATSVTDLSTATIITVYELYANGTTSKEKITKWDDDAYGYVIYVNKANLTGDVTLTITYPVVYTLLFDLQCGTFNGNYASGLTKSFKVQSGTAYSAFFDTQTKEELDSWAKGAKIFGYAFKGFYLVDSANSIITYGKNLDELIKSTATINASTTFYARWSFLVELIEAPGTYIKPSFPSSFMEYYSEKDDVNRPIEIPINSNKGYIFTIEKDSDFVGEASVKAYNVNKVGTDEVITEITIEKYHDNMYLYYIPPESINGYLVIVTSVSNSEIIVGENSSSVTEEIVPEDGVRTFKYVVNHTYKPSSDPNLNEVSYIYDSGIKDNKGYNLTLQKQFVLRFLEETRDTDGVISQHARHLAPGTFVEVHYTVCYNNDPTTTKHIVAAYEVVGHDVTEIYLSDFKLLDMETKAFTETTFKEFLGSYSHISETYYFVIQPPNGCFDHIQNEVKSFIIEGGYIDSNTNDYVNGVRSGKDLASVELNKGDLQDLREEFLKETSKESKVYGVTPSRVTILEKTEDGYKFSDHKDYEIYDVHLINTSVTNGYIRLFDDATQSIVESGDIKFGIKKLILSLGYGLGEVRIEGYDGNKWVQIAEINVNSAVYTDYEIPFNGYNYSKFRIDNISANEIRLNKLIVMSRNNDYLYEDAVSEFVFKGDLNSYSYEGDIQNFIFTNGSTYTITHTVIGDERHNGKSFMLAVQVSQNGVIVDNIKGSIYITAVINDVTYTYECLNNDYAGKNVAYIDLTSILNNYNISSFEFTLTVPNEYEVKTVQLLEVKNIYKPAMGSVRYQFTK